MESITISLPELGPMGYVIGYTLATLTSGIFMFRNIGRTGQCYAKESKAKEADRQVNEMIGNSCLAKCIVSGVITLTFLIMTLIMSYDLFEKAMK